MVSFRPGYLAGFVVYLMIRWCISLGAKFARVVPVRTLWIVIFTIGSQVAMLAASLLPLKIIMMLGSDGIPRYFPSFFLEFERNTLLMWLSIAAVVAFVSHLLFENLIGRITAAGSAVLLQRSNKMMLFDNQDTLAASAYQRFSRALAGWIFVFLLGSVMGWLYPKLALTVSIVILIACLYMTCAYRLSISYRNNFSFRLKDGAKLWANIGFFTAFGFLLFDYVYGNPPPFIISILSVLLMRQLLGRLSSGVVDFYSLWLQRHKLDALFFHGKTLLSNTIEVNAEFWTFLQPQERVRWLPEVLADLLGAEVVVHHHEWLSSGGAGVVGLRVVTDSKQLLVRVFNKNRKVQASHEAELMLENIEGLPVLPWVGMSQVGDYQCLVYELVVGEPPQKEEVKKLAQKIKLELSFVKLPERFVKHFSRSKPLLWQRLTVDLIERLLVVSTDEQREVEKLISGLPTLLEHIKRLPVTLIQPDLRATHLWLTNAEELHGCALQWTRWSIEPVGAGLVRSMSDLKDLDETVAHIMQEYHGLKIIEPEEIKLGAYLFWFEELCGRENLTVALQLLPYLLEVAEPYLSKHSK